MLQLAVQLLVGLHQQLSFCQLLSQVSDLGLARLHGFVQRLYLSQVLCSQLSYHAFQVSSSGVGLDALLQRLFLR